ncbi:1-acyl-sn-glycerol-3-phosphate acyltransferase [Acinetobacter nectaris]|uniref:1-acyl-sn-glycerol-3-phosphate acyltransferase n=1 Tax=Acinetobacter nectaris TaxID=1219382 RepID=UPI001F02CB0A|nr:1-acyl-sn-glycerol-3-phosphate acyltransferase [Acinetobacter nectaris]MCF9034338.1 1-acyl-sn-glycerol-3-phosphate acyltransferase [Acinetobacter nectaris]
MSKSNYPILPSNLPNRGSKYTRIFFQKLLHAQKWSFEGNIPNLPKGIAILLPHTSNLDGWYALIGILGLGVKISILAKDDLFNTPLKPLLHKVDIIPIKRNTQSGFTQQAIDTLNNKERIWIGMAPEGTRQQAPSFKSGFYRIADGAEVPIVMFSLNYQTKTLTCIGSFMPSGNYEKDLPNILSFYTSQNCYPKHLSRLSLPLQKQLKIS